MGSLLAHAATEQSLLSAWDEVREAALADGVAGPEVERFEAGAARHVAQISAKLHRGAWQPQPVHHVKMAKSSGGYRHLGIPVVEDRIVERAILSVLDPLIDPLLQPWSFAYRRGLGVDAAIRAVVEARDSGCGWVARCDIKDCFDAIPRWAVITLLRSVCDDPELVDLIRQFVYRPALGRRDSKASRGRGLHQGSPLSPLLANLYLDQLDRAAAAEGLRVVRFADDIAVPVETRADGERALALLDEAARALDLELNLGKSTVVSFDEGVDFLGQSVTSSSGVAPLASAHPLETTVYVAHQGALLRSRGERAIVQSGDETLARVNLRRVRQVVIFGRVGMTTAFIHQLLRRGIEVILLDEHGNLSGRFESVERATPHVRQAQYRVAGHSAALGFARQFVAGKLQNMRVMLLRTERRYGELGYAPAVKRLAQARTKLSDAATVAEVMGFEGAGSREYFQLWTKALPAEWGFTGRARRPPPDPVNAMLSFGYTLLVNEGISAAVAAGLDPYVGLLHRAMRGRAAMALDLIEELRPTIVDSAVLGLIGRRAIRPEHFDTVPEVGCRLTDAGRRIFLDAYERRMLELVTYPGTSRRISYRVALHQQAKALAAALISNGEYRPLYWK